MLKACAKTFRKCHFTELDDSLGINAGPHFVEMRRHYGKSYKGSFNMERN